MRKLMSVALAGVLLLTLAGTTFAAKGSKSGTGGTGSGVAACSVTPNPVAVGSDWTMTGAGLPAGSYVNVWEKDSASTTVWFAQIDASGTVSITWHSYNVGTTTMSVTSTSGNDATLASCTFQVD